MNTIAENAKIYLRPIHFIESPQQHDGASERLAGTMLWFSAVELIARNPGEITRRIVSVSTWDAELAGLPPTIAEQAQNIYKRLKSARAPLQMGARTIRLDQPQVMAILNVTPDSFSDGGKHVDSAAAISAGVAMAAAGAALVDVGGESTRPNAATVWEGDETARVEPVIRGLANAGTATSVDTRKAAVMEAALAAGAGMINDVSALLYDDRALEVAQSSTAPIVLMHAPGQGSNPHKGAAFDNALFDIYDWLEARVDAVASAGIARERLIVDPGLGFGYGEAKSLTDDLSLVNNLSLFHGLGCPILFGASRKRMIGALSNEAPADTRLGGSLFLAMKAVEQGAQIVRVHDVPETVQAIHVWRGLRDAALTARA